MEAGKHTSQQRENYTSKGWSLGANIGVNGSGIIGANAGFNKAKQTGNTDVTTHTGTNITATNTASITSGNDTTLVDSKAIGEQVTANVGGNLSIISVQDEKTYTGTSSNKGLSISTTGGSIGNVSFANNKGSMNSTYRSVTEQAGLYAGDKGFSVNTKGITSLVGEAIHSDAEASKNTLTTGSLTTESIHNTAEYTSRNMGVSYTHRGDFKHLSQAGKDAVWNTLGLLPVLQPDATDDAQSTTNSAISSGTIKVTDNSANLDQLSRDTANSLNKLDEIFDKKKVEERQELSQLFAKEAFAQLHDWNPTSPEGKAAKAIAHGIVAETSARIAGNKAGSGFYAGATNEALIGEIQKVAKDNPAVAQWLSASIGAVVNEGMGSSTVTGAAVAQYGTKWNNYVKRPTHEGAILLTKDSWFQVQNGVDVSIEPPPAGTIFWKQNPIPGEQRFGWDFEYGEGNSMTYIPGDVETYGIGGRTVVGSRLTGFAKNAFEESLDWKSGKVTEGRIGYVGTLVGTATAFAEDADASKYSDRDMATRQRINAIHQGINYAALKKLPPVVSVPISTGLDEQVESFKDFVAPPRTKAEIDIDNELYFKEQVEEGMD